MNRVINIASWLWKRKFGALILIVIVGAGVVKEGYFTGFTLTNGLTGTKRVVGIVDSANGSNALTNLITEYYLQNAIAGLELGSGNKMEVYNVRDYGAVPNVSVPGSGSTVTGTNQRAAFLACLSAVPRGGIMFVGPGNWLVEGCITIDTKDVIYIQVGNVYTNGGNYLVFNSAGGQDRAHSVIITGKLIGRVNIPTNSATTRANGTSPVWSSFTGVGITISTNVNNMHVKVKWIEGFFKAVEILGGGGGGSQENTIAFMRFHNNSIGISLRSTDGVGWCDKNVFTGWDNGTGRITGGLSLKIDGFASPAPNGEVYNGAFRSNKFKFMNELTDSIVQANGDITETEFEIIIEGGVTTGVLGNPALAIVCRSVSPNYVRGPRWTGLGVLATQWMTAGMGIDGTIDQHVWLGPGSIAYIGNRGKIDGNGVINMEVRPNLAKATRDALPANIKCVNEAIPKVTRTVAQPTYTTVAADIEGWLLLNNSPMVLTMGSASANVNVTIHIKNLNASNATLFNVSGKATLAQNESVDVFSDGTTWRATATGYSYTPT